MSLADQSALRAWLREMIDKGGRGTATRLAVHLDVQPTVITRMSSMKPGKEVRDIKVHELQQIITFFGESPPGLGVAAAPTMQEVVPSNARFILAPIIGVVEAGAFREVDEFDQSEFEEILVERDTRFPRARVLVFEIRGDSMNALERMPLRPGYHAVGVAFDDIEDRYPLRDGMIVVLERTRDGGHLREWSIKEVVITDDHFEFWPRSTNPKHAPIVVPLDYFADDGTDVRVIAFIRSIVGSVDPD